MATTTSDDGILQPGQSIKPQMNEAIAIDLVRRLYGFEPVDVIELPSYDDRNYRIIVDADRCHGNPHVREVSRHGYVLKVLNSLDSQKRHVEAQHEIMRILHNKDINCPQPVLNKFGQDKSLELISETTSVDTSSQDQAATSSNRCKHVVRLLTYLPGERLITAPYTAGLLHRFGQYIGKVDRALEGFYHEALEEHRTIWHLSSVTRLRQFTYAIKDDNNRQLVHDVIDAFERDVLPQETLFKRGAIHGDYNEQNIIVQPIRKQDHETDEEFEIAGVIDFGDSTMSPYIYEIAIAMMYAMLDSVIVDAMSVGGHVLSGYFSAINSGDHPLLIGPLERQLFRTCLAARFAQSLTMGAYTYSLDSNNVYLLTTAKRGWPMLDRLWRQTTDSELYARWDAVMTDHYGMSYFTDQFEEITRKG